MLKPRAATDRGKKTNQPAAKERGNKAKQPAVTTLSATLRALRSTVRGNAAEQPAATMRENAAKEPAATEHGNKAKQSAAKSRVEKTKVSIQHFEVQSTRRGKATEKQTPDVTKRERQIGVTAAEEREEVPKKARGNDHAAAGRPKHVAAGEEALHPAEGLATVVRLFAGGWFPEQIYGLLYSAVTRTVANCDSSMLRIIESFETKVLRIGGNPDGDWKNQWQLKDALSKLRQVRRQYANDFSSMSEENAYECLWTFARTFIFSQEQANLNKRKQRSILSHVIHRDFGCQYRLRAMIRIGLQPFDRWEDDHDLLKRFLCYLEKIESTAKGYKGEGMRIQSWLEWRSIQGNAPQTQLDVGRQEIGLSSSTVRSCCPTFEKNRRYDDRRDQAERQEKEWQGEERQQVEVIERLIRTEAQRDGREACPPVPPPVPPPRRGPTADDEAAFRRSESIAADPWQLLRPGGGGSSGSQDRAERGETVMGHVRAHAEATVADGGVAPPRGGSVAAMLPGVLGAPGGGVASRGPPRMRPPLMPGPTVQPQRSVVRVAPSCAPSCVQRNVTTGAERTEVSQQKSASRSTNWPRPAAAAGPWRPSLESSDRSRAAACVSHGRQSWSK